MDINYYKHLAGAQEEIHKVAGLTRRQRRRVAKVKVIVVRLCAEAYFHVTITEHAQQWRLGLRLVLSRQFAGFRQRIRFRLIYYRDAI